MTVNARFLAAILGPTAAGKSALGVSLAESLAGEVVSCDSTQVYRGFDIGTAKLPVSERRGVPHHLLDFLDSAEIFHAGEYRRRAIAVLEDLAARRKFPVFTVGTGLYLRALLEGLCEAPARSEVLRDRLRRRAARSGPAHLHRLLARLDPPAASRIGPRDTPKLIRAIEVRLLSGKPLSELHRAGRQPLETWRTIKIGLLPPRAALYARIERRAHTMLAAGWLDEVRRLVDAGVPADAKPFQFIGYRELREHLEGKLSIEEAVARIQQATRLYAKRQLTWFRRETGVYWLEGFGDDPEIARAALAYVQSAVAASTSSDAAPAEKRDPASGRTL